MRPKSPSRHFPRLHFRRLEYFVDSILFSFVQTFSFLFLAWRWGWLRSLVESILETTVLSFLDSIMSEHHWNDLLETERALFGLNFAGLMNHGLERPAWPSGLGYRTHANA